MSELEFPRATLPWAPLEAHIVSLLRRDGIEVTRRNIADLLGVSLNAVRNYQYGSKLYPLYADRYAVALGMHPSSIWADAWWDSYEVDRQHQLAIWRDKDARKRRKRRNLAPADLLVVDIVVSEEGVTDALSSLS